MSNFTAPTRLKGSNDKYKMATWLDGYFGGRRYGVRFHGSSLVWPGDKCEIKEVEMIKFRAWKRLKDKGLKIREWEYIVGGFEVKFDIAELASIRGDLELLFGGEDE